MQSFVPTFTFRTNIIASPGQTTTAKNGVLIGHRETGGDLIVTSPGYPQPSIYEPLLLPAFTDGTSALNYMTKLGFNVAFGVRFDLNLPAPTSAALQVDGTWLLTWTTVPSNFYEITTLNAEGIITQGANTGNVLDAQIIVVGLAENAIMSVDPIMGSTFDIITAITLAGLINNSYPDPENTDEICMQVWYYYQSAVSLPTSPNGQPSAYISVLSDRDTTHSPNPATFALVAPTSAVVNGTSVTLTYPIAAANLGYLPFNKLGSTSLTQAVSLATGTFDSMTVNNTTVAIVLTDVTGTFDITNVINVALDSTVNVFTYLQENDAEINNVVSPYEILTSADYVTYADFFTGISVLNNGTFITKNKYFVQGILGNITTLPTLANTLPEYNSQLIKQISYPYQQMFLDIPFAATYLASAQAYVNNNPDVPYLPQEVYLTHIPISRNVQNRYNVVRNGNADVAMNKGWAVWGVSSQGRAYLVRDITSLITIPNTSITDVEFRFQHVWDVVRFITKDIYQQWQVFSVSPVINGGRILNSPDNQATFRDLVVGRLYFYQGLQLLQNVSAYADQVTVITNPSSPTGILVTIPAVIIPGLGSADVVLNIFSVYNVFTNAA